MASIIGETAIDACIKLFPCLWEETIILDGDFCLFRTLFSSFSSLKWIGVKIVHFLS
jgi:hypothetical protein